MGSVDRPGGAERPEHGDRPLSDAERTARYEEWVEARYSDPEQRKKLDPFERMSLDELERLYLPEATDGADDRSSEAEQPVGEPQWHDESETVRQIRADHGDRDAGDREPTGDELLAIENDEASLRERALRSVGSSGADWSDSWGRFGGRMEDFLAEHRPPTSYAETRPPEPLVSEPPRHGVEGDSFAEAVFAVGYVTAVAYNSFVRGKGKVDDGN